MGLVQSLSANVCEKSSTFLRLIRALIRQRAKSGTLAPDPKTPLCRRSNWREGRCEKTLLAQLDCFLVTDRRFER